MRHRLLVALDVLPFLLLPGGLFVYLLAGEQVTLSRILP